MYEKLENNQRKLTLHQSCLTELVSWHLFSLPTKFRSLQFLWDVSGVTAVSGIETVSLPMEPK